ncbi:tetratricopeptide repeat protein [Pseudomarimonas arenosa]|uniref:protein O-GlcNAc transferase n=1 Tax=Pseudomarimonas arenosa TaxID=2774145 RepID=A0AAW3ZKU4_9GAMM|nr:tetratricopeptide repeat protein [Pseudomarimonas arenosa]MBD8526651.1 tetratricopeptide repeat protein [Pseudomarimonas arenosa]
MPIPSRPGRAKIPQPIQTARAAIQAGRPQEALAPLRKHLNQQPNDAASWGVLGHCLRVSGDLGGAEQALARAARLDPRMAATLREQGFLKRDQGQVVEAVNLLGRYLQLHDEPAVRFEAARLAADLEPRVAESLLAPLLAAHPKAFELVLLSAQIQSRLGQVDSAIATLEALRQQRPNDFNVVNLLYWARVQRGDDALLRIDLARQLAESTQDAERWLNLAQELQHAGRFAEGRAAVESALRANPDFLPAHWAKFQLPPSPAPESEAAVEQFRQAWAEGLAHFESIDFESGKHNAQIWGCVGQCTAFYRHYLGDEVEDLQQRYGRLLRRMMHALAPDSAERPLRQGKRRIGFVSAYFREHTVARLFVPLIEQLDRERFEVHVFSLDDVGDRWSQRLQVGSLFHAGRRGAPEWRKLIDAAELDVLVYSEIGMHPLTQGLAALRLAPVQAVLWGHPVTTGLDTIDLFLSADQLEPADADRHYLEPLVRLPDLGHGLSAADLPEPTAPTCISRREQGIELLCAQSVFKMLPAQDYLFAAILDALPNARLHLLADHRADVRHWLQQRMARAFAERGSQAIERVQIHGFLSHADYLGLSKVSDLNLDTIGWSGGMSALDLLAAGLPTVCLPGSSMRSRQTACLLQLLGLDELIARDQAHYIELAVSLARAPERLQDLRHALQERRNRLFGSTATHQALAELLAGVGRDSRGQLILPPGH